MSSKIICYDLCAPSRNYDELYKAIKSYDEWAHLSESTWFVKTSESCVQIRNKLLSKIDDNDRLFVAGLTGEAAWYRVIGNDDYLIKHL
jgi:hypothetical protein